MFLHKDSIIATQSVGDQLTGQAIVSDINPKQQLINHLDDLIKHLDADYYNHQLPQVIDTIKDNYKPLFINYSDIRRQLPRPQEKIISDLFSELRIFTNAIIPDYYHEMCPHLIECYVNIKNKIIAA